MCAITGIDPSALASLNYESDPLSKFSVAQRMSWAAGRQTSREEDIAYSLLGIFDTNMPLLYGEAEHAFTRLQEEIIRRSADQTIFAWKSTLHDGARLLAPSPRNFKDAKHIVPWQTSKDVEPYTIANSGLSIQLPILQYNWGHCAAILNCRYTNDCSGPIALLLSDASLLNTVHTYQVVDEKDAPDYQRTLIVDEESITSASVRSILILTRPMDLKGPGPSYARAATFVVDDVVRGVHRPFRADQIITKLKLSKESKDDYFPNSYWNAKSRTLLLPANAKTHATARMRWGGRSLALLVGFSIHPSSVNYSERRKVPWISIVACTSNWTPLSSCHPPLLEDRRPFDRMTDSSGKHVVDIVVHEKTMMKESVYLIQANYVSEIGESHHTECDSPLLSSVASSSSSVYLPVEAIEEDKDTADWHLAPLETIFGSTGTPAASRISTTSIDYVGSQTDGKEN